jgi:beta-glucosidase
VFHTPESQELSLQAAREGIVLLKNDKGVLPLDKKGQTIAVIGPLAASNYSGGYSSPDAKGISILDGLRRRAGGDADIRYAKGYDADARSGTDLMGVGHTGNPTVGAPVAGVVPGSGGDATGSGATVAGRPEVDSAALLLQEAVDLVKRSDAAVVVLGEEPREVGEGKDRTNLDLSVHQMILIKAIYNTGKPVSVVLFNGRPLSIGWVADHIPAIVESWFGGEKGGLAIADVLLGKVNPSGKLPISFPRSVGQLPFYYDHKPTSSHRYVDEADSLVFPFGLGLSYTRFDYSDLRISPGSIAAGARATVSVTVKNIGGREGDEVAQLYIRDVVSSVTTPAIALRGFGRIHLKPGESGMVRFVLEPDDLALWNRQMKRVVEPGEFKIMVGSSSKDIRQTGSLRVTAN